jgi:hypothetical protein
MKNIVVAALFLFASAIASAQCVAFLVPPDVPVYAAEEGARIYAGVRTDYTLVFPDWKLAWSAVPLVAISDGRPIPKRAACFPADFKKSKDSSRIHAQMRQERSGEFFDVWIVDKESIPIVYDSPPVTGDVRLQSAVRNLTAIQHAADLKLDQIRNADFKPPEIKNQEVLAADFDKTWSALVETLSDQKWQIESIDKGSGLITTKPAIDKGGSTMACATRFDQEHKTWLNVFAKKVEGGTRVKVNATFHALREDQAINCYSNGTIEREIFKGIQENIGPAQPAQTPGKSSP